METWTINRLLTWISEYFTKQNIDSPRLSAEMLLSHVLDLKRIELYMHFERPVNKPQLDRLHELVRRAAAGEPVSYLVGRKEFYSLEIKVTPDCLIPRPETELLVEKAIEFLRKRQAPQYVCDLCTGSGCIAVAIARGVEGVQVTATDICDAALAVAAENVEHHQLTGSVKLLCGDLFAPVIEGLDQTEFDLIVSNPPYISTPEMEKLDANVKDYEPRKALHAGPEGLDVYKKLIDQAGRHLTDDGALMLEIGWKQGADVCKLLENADIFSDIRLEKDFQQNDRVITARK